MFLLLLMPHNTRSKNWHRNCYQICLEATFLVTETNMADDDNSAEINGIDAACFIAATNNVDDKI